MTLQAPTLNDTLSHQHETVDDLDLLLRVLPAPIREKMTTDGELPHLLEIVLDLGRLPEARYEAKTEYVLDTPISREDLQFIVARVGAFTHDNRAGLPRTLHRISALRNRTGDVIGLTCRVGRAVFGTVDIVKDTLTEGRESILLLGPPGVGKTTLLREAARVLADECGKRVIVVDTSNEIAGDGDIPHPAIGRARRMQVPSPDLQHKVMIEAVENHMPEVIVVDEIGTEAEALAARTIAERGVRLIATAHGSALENLIQNPTLADLIGGIQSVTLGDDEARRRGTQKTVLERKAPPTFDILIEIHDRANFAIHADVAKAVDSFLRRRPPQAELRTRHADGHIDIRQPEPDEPSMLRESGDTMGRRKTLRLFPYGINRHRLEQAIHELEAPAQIVNHAEHADVIVTVRGQVKRQSRELRFLVENGKQMYAMRSDTFAQMHKCLRDLLVDAFPDEQEALTEAATAINQVLEQNVSIELAPRKARLRRLQHELVKQQGLHSKSQGDEPFRRIVIYPV